MLGGASRGFPLPAAFFCHRTGSTLQDDSAGQLRRRTPGKAIGGDILGRQETYLMVTAMSRSTRPREVLRTAYRDATLSDTEGRSLR